MGANTESPKPAASGGGRTVRGWNTAVSILVAAAIVVMANFILMRHYVRADWTSSGMYTLSDKTEKVVQALTEDVSLYVLWSQGDEFYPDVKEVLDNYSALSRHVKVEVIDPDRSPDRAKLIIGKYGAKVKTTEYGEMGIVAGVFVAVGDNVKFVASNELEDLGGGGMFDEGGGEGQEGLSEFKAEQQITSAILRVTSGEQETACFTQGHGEWEFEGFGERSLRHVKDALRQDSYKVEALPTAGASRVPEKCAIVVVAGPTRAFMEDEAELLDRYLSRGGRLLLLLDPIVEEDAFKPTGLEGLVGKRGIKLDNDIVLELDQRRLFSESPLEFFASEVTSHAAVKALAVPPGAGADVLAQMSAFPVAVSLARSLSPAEGSEITADVLAKSSESSWGETDAASLTTGERTPEPGPSDVTGPAALAMAATVGGKDGGRLAVVGDSDFLAEALFQHASLYNRDLWSGLVGWLTDREDLISIAPKNREHVRLDMTEDDATTVWMVVIGEVLAMLVLGVAMWLVRRR